MSKENIDICNKNPLKENNKKTSKCNKNQNSWAKLHSKETYLYFTGLVIYFAYATWNLYKFSQEQKLLDFGKNKKYLQSKQSWIEGNVEICEI